MSHFRRFRHNSNGSAIIEFAVVAPVLFLLLVGFIELGLILLATSLLEGATDVGARIGKTNYTLNDLDRQTYILNQINNYSGGLLNPANITITVKSYTFSSTGVIGAATTNFTGGAGALVEYRVSYPWQIFTPLFSSVFGTGGVYTINAVSFVRNEAFQ